MLDFNRFRIGCSIELPEIATHIANESSTFIVKNVFLGGMGVCIQLWHPETRQEFALKCIRPDFVGKQATIERFIDELKVWTSVSSCDLIAEALAVVRLNELPCVLATWMPNGDLSDALPRLTKTNKIEALLRIVRGLSWVNSNFGVIHRDLKPSNILLDEYDLAYVADWGLARPVGSVLQSVGKAMLNTVNRPDRTQLGSFIGTVTYAAPEQIKGSAEIDHRADIYALGCMMFEFETGSPPFEGETVFDIASQHLHKPPRKLGTVLRRTNLGLEHIIAVCLEKDPKDRYQSYERLESDLLAIAKKQGVSLERCEPGTRYKRTILGEGEQQQMDMFINAPTKNRGKDGYMVVDMDDILPFLKEANDLVALGRYEEAEKIYRPYVLPQMLGKWMQWWGLPHDMAVNYCLCLEHLGRALEAENLFLVLVNNNVKPAVFYVNYSLILNRLNKGHQAADLCIEGLKYFHDDIDIQGNLTIALILSGEYERAADSAFKRLTMRRDVHSLDGAADALIEYAMSIRDVDLPRAMALAKMIGDLIKEGLNLNPNYHILRLREVLLRRLIQDAVAVNTIAPTLWRSESVPFKIREDALIEMLEDWADNGYGTDVGADAVLQFIKNHPEWLSVIPKLKEIELRTIARYKMMRDQKNSGQRIVLPEIADYFLKKNPSGLFLDPILAAQLKGWLGETEEALSILSTYLTEMPFDFNALRAIAILHSTNENSVEAIKYAQLLVEVAPWRAESYDCLAYIAAMTGNATLENQANIRGNKVFAEEMQLYEEAKALLN